MSDWRDIHPPAARSLQQRLLAAR